MFKSKRELRADNRRLRWENEDLKKQKDTLKDEVSVYRQKIECATGHVNPLVKTVEALCTNPEYDKWDNHPAAMILVQSTRAYSDAAMFQELDNVPGLAGPEEKAEHEHQNTMRDGIQKNHEITKQQSKNEAWNRTYGKSYNHNEPLFPPMQADEFDSDEFVRFSREEYESMIESTATVAPESERIAIEPGIAAIYAQPWGYDRLTEDSRGLKRVSNDYWGKWAGAEYRFAWPFLLTTVEGSGHHSAAVACLYHKPILICGRTEMHADIYEDYRKSEIFHRITSDGVYWLKDEKPYCRVSDVQKAVIWMILHTIMEAPYPIRYKGVEINKKGQRPAERAGR